MAGSGQIRAGKAYVEIGSDNSSLQKGLNAAAAQLKAFGSAITSLGTKMLSLGTSILAPLAAASKGFADAGSHLADMASRTGVSVEALSRLSYVAKQSGTDIDALELGLRHMQKTVVDAAKGSAEAVDALDRLHLTIEDLKGLSPEQQFAKIASRLDAISDPAVKAATAMAIFGKSGTALLPMMEGGADAMNALMKRAEDLGLVMSGEDARAAKALGDGLSELWDVIKMGVFRIGGALAPALTRLSAAFATGLAAASKWISAHQDLIQIVAVAAAGVVAAGIAFVAVGKSISLLGGIIGGVSTAISIVGGIFGTVAAILSTVLFSGIGLVITGLAGLAAYLAYTSEVGGKVVGYLSGAFGTLKDDALAAFGGIRDAISAGNWGLAAQILWATLKLEFERGKDALLALWNGFKDSFNQIAAGAFFGALEAWNFVQHGLTVSWIYTVAAAKTIWANFSSGILKVWENVQSTLETAWLKLFNLFGTLSDEALEKAQDMSITNTVDKQNDIEAERKKDVADADKQLTDNSGAERKRYDAATLANGKGANAEADRIKKAAADRDEAQKSEVADLKKKLADLTKQAKDEAAAAKTKQLELPGMPKDPKLDTSLDDLNKKTQSAQGIFNSAAIQSLQAGGGSAAERTAKATEAVQKNTDRTVKAIEKMKPATFS
jgi:hypothetical protein